jgi:hypothetical protein
LQRIVKDALELVEAKGHDGNLDESKVELDAIEEALVNEELQKDAS